jgi:hypothetical protein
MNEEQQETTSVEDSFITMTLAIHEGETSALTSVLRLIDETLKNIGGTNICASSEITDSLLDMRNFVSPIVEARSVQ